MRLNTVPANKRETGKLLTCLTANNKLKPVWLTSPRRARRSALGWEVYTRIARWWERVKIGGSGSLAVSRLSQQGNHTRWLISMLSCLGFLAGRENKCWKQQVLRREKYPWESGKETQAREWWGRPHVDSSWGQGTRDVCWISRMWRGVSWQCSGQIGAAFMRHF